ncbi:MAG: hypothetical protein JWL63_1512 [Rhodocyclales bacterium]|nr:hypothetical protein [Rhodocyclales bacterium]
MEKYFVGTTHSQRCIQEVVGTLARFAILTSHVHEAVGQIRQVIGDKSFQAAITAAEMSGLLARRRALLR